MTKVTKLTKYEQETIITFNEEEPFAYVYTYNKSLQRKLSNLSQKSSTVTLTRKEYGWEEYQVPKRAIKVQIPRQLSSENKQLLAERARRNFGHGEQRGE